MAQVVLDCVSKVYPGNVKAVDEVSLHIKDAEFIVLVGPSGCGKSTTLRMVAGLEEITGGTIRIGDRIVNDVPPKDRDVAMVFQNYALYPHMSVYNNMAFGLKLRKVPKAQIAERVKWAATILGIEKLLDRKPKALSGGQRQRVAVGRAIVRQPKAFLFDEPLSNLDAKLRVETRAELKQLHHRLKTTTIYVTHDQEEAMTLGDRVVVMDQGVIQQCDTPINVYNHPANLFVAGFLGMPPMNVVDGKLERRGQDTWFTGQGVALKLTAEKATRVQSYVGRDVVMGLRPEAIRLHPAANYGEEPDHRAAATVNVIEPLGSSMDIFLRTSTDKRLIARVPAESQVKPDTAVTLYVDATRMHIFAPPGSDSGGGSGKNLTLES